jgi:hypothetical protein
LAPFVQCAETTETRFTFSVPAGSSVYYRVSAVAFNGEESARSFYVMGSSLAQPVITDITDVTEASATVTWYMENVSDATYRANLRYTVYCFDQADGTEVAQLAIDGSQITANRAVFTGLLAEREYEYQVEAYLVSDQSNSEKSDIMDKKTARRLIPSAPEKLTASRGASTETITLSFELPEKIKIALSADEIEEHEIYFVIYKRFYNENGGGEYVKVCTYFGAEVIKNNNPRNNAAANADAEKFPGSYEFGKTVTWTDEISETNSIIRGVKYEYQVQSYVDATTKTITSDTSRASTVGWTLAAGNVSIGKPVYTANEDETLYVSAAVPLKFVFDPKGEEYRYRVLETINPIGDGNEFDPAVEINRGSAFLSYEQITGYTVVMDLTQKTTADSPGRGLYSYGINICLPNGTVIDTVTAIGDVLVSEDVHPIVVEGFSIQDGYTNKFRITWDSAPNRKYILFKSTDKTTWEEVVTYNDPPSDDESEPAVSRIEDLTGYEPGITVYFALQPVRVLTEGFNTIDKKGQRVYLTEGAQTLGVPELLPAAGYSYSTVTTVWKEAQKADTYRIKYRYTGDGNWTTAATLSRDALSLDVTGTLRYPFRPNGYDDVTKSGKAMQIAVDALNEGLRNQVGGGEIVTTSTDGVARLVGPAELEAQVSKAASADYIEVSWNKVAGAGGYYVFRRQFNMDNTAEERGAVVYYIPAQETSITVTGKELTKNAEETIVDTTIVKAAASFTASRYTLKDEYMIDHEYEGGFARHIQNYREQQNELAWGCPYRYFIVPVLSNEPLNSVEFTYAKDFNSKNTGITSYTLRENGTPISYSGAADIEQFGFTIGFGIEVTASKGTKSASGQVEISWKAPPLLAGAGFTPQYMVFRRRNSKSESDSPDTTWRPVSDSINITTFTDQPEDRGIAYDYAVGIYPAGGDVDAVLPPISARFIRIAKERYLDEKERPKLIGFTLASVKMIKISRSQFDDEGVELKDSQGNFLEKVEWYAGGIDGADSYKGNLYDNNWGIDGYEIYVMNRNVNNQWHKIAELTNPPNNTNQNVLVSDVQGGATLESGLLKVLRDYKHYYKVRSYVFNEQNEKVLCPDPYYYYSNLNAGGSAETDYVKWGARQISADEFIKIALLYAADGVDQVNGTAWNTGNFGRSANANGAGTSGSVEVSSDFWVTSWDFNFKNYKTDLQTRAGDWVTFVTINGHLWAGTSATNQYPQRWGDLGLINIIGPADTPALYTGRMKIGNPGDLYWSDNNGRIYVYYPDNTAQQTITYRGEWTPLQFSGHGDQRYQQDAWK